MTMMMIMIFILVASSPAWCLQGDTPPGFINLGCGLNDPNGLEISYPDSSTMLYLPDDEYVETGVKRNTSGGFDQNDQYFNALRSFPDGNRSCYTFSVTAGMQVLLRAGFYYGNYDGLNRQPQFDIHLGVNYLETTPASLNSTPYTTEVIHTPSSEYLYLCLVNTGFGAPFISFVELRPIPPGPYDTTPFGAFHLSWRIYCTTNGDATISVIRFSIG
ncbi:hypothetical protein M569_10785 [Genlisea aurea]|uniref:Malectin-like domain-containing protein n=1 Tax=Genlisea aurea TaxID=192259 RepID=S8CHF1_9LAMI|nr:hypothetical protein M569_10785 [Genlisea aurea]